MSKIIIVLYISYLVEEKSTKSGPQKKYSQSHQNSLVRQYFVFSRVTELFFGIPLTTFNVLAEKSVIKDKFCLLLQVNQMNGHRIIAFQICKNVDFHAITCYHLAFIPFWL